MNQSKITSNNFVPFYSSSQSLILVFNPFFEIQDNPKTSTMYLLIYICFIFAVAQMRVPKRNYKWSGCLFLCFVSKDQARDAST